MNTRKRSRKAEPAPKGSRAAQAAVRRERVLTAAMELFCEHGYAATSTAKIARAASVAEGLIFHQFGNKQALLFAVAARHQTFAGRVLTLLAQPHDSARALLRAIAEGLTDVSSAERAFIGFMHAEAHVNAALRGHVVTATEAVLDGLVAALRPHVDRGELSAEADLRVGLEGFFGGFMFFLGQRRDVSGAAWRRDAAHFGERWADQCWRGLASAATLSEHSY